MKMSRVPKLLTLCTMPLLLAGGCVTQQAWLNDTVASLFTRMDRLSDGMEILLAWANTPV